MAFVKMASLTFFFLMAKNPQNKPLSDDFLLGNHLGYLNYELLMFILTKIKADVDTDKAALELEEWKQKQKERFKNQLQGLESHHVNLLTKEWEKREKERENLVHEKLSEIFSVEKELKQALEVTKNKQKSLEVTEKELNDREKKLNEREQKLQSLLGGNTSKKVRIIYRVIHEKKY